MTPVRRAATRRTSWNEPHRHAGLRGLARASVSLVADSVFRSFSLGPADALHALVTLVIAFVIALPVAWERERAARSAGLRTFPLVATASAA